MTTISENIQSLSPDNLVILYKLDASDLTGADGSAGPVLHFTSASDSNAPVMFGGVAYSPIDMEATGFETSSKGQYPQPKIKIANINKVVASAAVTYGDLVGATFTRIRTFRRFLDDGSEPDPDKFLPLDIFTVEQKTNYNKVYIEWALSSSIDQEGKQLPGRQFIRDACTHTYRFYNTTTHSFDYTKATCPYNGTAYFDHNNTVVGDPALDDCGRLLSSCRARFGQNGVLPTRAFPGIGSGF